MGKSKVSSVKDQAGYAGMSRKFKPMDKAVAGEAGHISPSGRRDNASRTTQKKK